MNKGFNFNWPSVAPYIHEKAKCFGDESWCVYYWQNKENGEIFYVGRGASYRFKSCAPNTRTRAFWEYVSKNQCAPVIIAYGMGKEKSIEIEKKVINAFWLLGFPLVNVMCIKERVAQVYPKDVKVFWNAFGETKPAKDWCSKYHISYSTVTNRVEHHGLTIEQALTFPPVPRSMRSKHKPLDYWKSLGLL